MHAPNSIPSYATHLSELHHATMKIVNLHTLNQPNVNKMRGYLPTIVHGLDLETIVLKMVVGLAYEPDLQRLVIINKTGHASIAQPHSSNVLKSHHQGIKITAPKSIFMYLFAVTDLVVKGEVPFSTSRKIYLFPRNILMMIPSVKEHSAFFKLSLLSSWTSTVHPVPPSNHSVIC